MIRATAAIKSLTWAHAILLYVVRLSFADKIGLATLAVAFAAGIAAWLSVPGIFSRADEQNGQVVTVPGRSRGTDKTIATDDARSLPQVTSEVSPAPGVVSATSERGYFRRILNNYVFVADTPCTYDHGYQYITWSATVTNYNDHKRYGNLSCDSTSLVDEIGRGYKAV